ncbi:hypothetical protein GQ42DRAFT_162327 [Ramicandelaber brevisporus]|nr:hypothetical protein GQ42DRAFT_162327 [Ramicandelaber brevisporus]
MTNTLHGYIYKKRDDVLCEFEINSRPFLGLVELSSLAAHLTGKFSATLEYDNSDDLNGLFTIGDNSVVGPSDLILSLVNESGAKAKITTRISPPLPSGLSNHGTVDFGLPF